jgi:plasmid stabilization system protein ParE
MKINYSLESIHDLIRLRKFIQAKNPNAAERIASELLAGIDNLKVFPRMGLPVSRAPNPDDIRDLFVSTYTVRYLLGRQDIFILRVWHEKEIGKDL